MPNNSKSHQVYIEALRRLTPEQRLQRAFDLTESSKQLFIHGLRKLHPDMPEDEFKALVRKRLDKCHNRNW